MVVFVDPIEFGVVHYPMDGIEYDLFSYEEDGKLPNNCLYFRNALHVHFYIEFDKCFSQGQKRPIEKDI